MHMRLRPDILQRQAPVAHLLATLTEAVDTFGEIVLVADRDGELVGFAWRHLRESSSTPYERQRYDPVIRNITVEPHCRRLGIATRLVAAAEAEGVKWGATGVELDVRDGNPAAAFYAAIGYAPARTTLTKAIGAERVKR